MEKTPLITAIYLLYIALGTVERVRSTFSKKRFINPVAKISELWLTVPFYSYLALVALAVIEHLFEVHTIHIGVSLAGFGLYLAGVLLRRKAITDLGDNWSLHTELRTGHELVAHGIYRHVKHPYYTAVLLELIGASLVGNAYGTALLVVLTQLPLLAARTRREEMLLAKHFTDRYESYSKGKLL